VAGHELNTIGARQLSVTCDPKICLSLFDEYTPPTYNSRCRRSAEKLDRHVQTPGPAAHRAMVEPTFQDLQPLDGASTPTTSPYLVVYNNKRQMTKRPLSSACSYVQLQRYVSNAHSFLLDTPGITTSSPPSNLFRYKHLTTTTHLPVENSDYPRALETRL
jgi:hypothetical protein